jgi:hypothetical protein
MTDKKPESAYTSLCEHTQQERCQLSECDAVKKFRIPSKDNPLNQQIIPSIDESLADSPSYIPRHPPVYHKSPSTYDNNDDDPNGSSFAETQVIIVQSIQLSSSSSPPPSYFVVRKRTRKGKKQNRKHFAQNNPSFPYNGPHW